MRTPSSIVVWAAVLAAASATPLPAQRRAAAAPVPASTQRLRWGPQVSYDFSGNHVGVGGRLEYSLAGLLGSDRVDGAFEANWFPQTNDVFDLTYNVVYNFQSPKLKPYAGGGLSLFIGNGTTLHLDAVGGLKFKPMGKVTPLVQLRYVFVQGDALLLTAGILF